MTPSVTVGDRLRQALAGYDRSALLLLPAVVFLLALFIYPLLYGAQLSLLPESGPPLANYQRFWSDPFFRDTIWLTLRLAIPGTVIVTAIALPLAVLMRGRFRGKGVVSSSLVFPVTLGAVLIGKGLLGYLGPTGWLNKSLLALNIIDAPLTLTHNYWGVLLAIIIWTCLSSSSCCSPTPRAWTLRWKRPPRSWVQGPASGSGKSRSPSWRLDW